MTDNKICFPWPRYWFPEGNNDYGTFIQRGFLTLPSPEYTHYFKAAPRILSEIAKTPVLILLGDPGYGKSHALTEENNRLISENSNDLIIFCDLKTFGPGDQDALRCKLLDEGKLTLVEQGHRLWVLLDGLDECTLHAPADWLVREFINKIRNPERVFVRITCRASSWPERLEKAFSDRWSSVAESPTELWRLCPLRQDDICIAAQASKIQVEDFLSAIANYNVQELAALPVTLQFMLRLFQENQLPKQRTEIFEKGLMLLCEDSPERRNSTIKSQIPTKVRFQAATRIALGYILQGCKGIWLGPSVECPNDLFDAEEITSKEAEYEINEQVIRETVELTGIFARLDGQRFQFASRTFAEFLAAWYIAKSKVPTLQKLKVLLHPDSQRLIPDQYETAAWLGALDSDFLGWLVNHEPEAALESDFATLALSDLPALVDGLLSLADEEQRQFYDWQKLAKLKNPGLDSKLSGVIADSSGPITSRALAIRIVNACELQSLGSELAYLALNDQEDLDLRKLATSHMENMDDNAKLLLIPIAVSDKNLSLKASALAVLGPKLMGAEAFFSQISPDFLETAPSELRYCVDEDSFLSALNADGLIIGLKWIALYTPIGHDRFTTNRLKSRLLIRAFDHLIEPFLVETLVTTMKVLRSNYESFFDGLERNEQQNPFDDTEKRHIFLTELINQIDLYEANDWVFSNETCFQEKDCLWLFQQFDQSSSEDKRHLIAAIIGLLVQKYSNLEAFEEIINRVDQEVVNPDPILAAQLASLVYPMDLTSESTICIRNLYFDWQARVRKDNQRQQTKGLPNPPEFYIQSNLAACEAGDFNRWSDLIGSLALQENGQQVFPHDPDSLPGWKNADDKLRNRIAKVAINYLEHGVPQEAEVLLQNTRTLDQAACGLAVAILVVTNNLQDLSKEHITRWCLSVVTHFFDHEIQQQIFRKVRLIVPDSFDNAVLKKIDQEAQDGTVHLLQSCREVWHPDFLQQLATSRLNSPNWPFDSRLRLAELLIQNNIGSVIDQIEVWLTTESVAANRLTAATSLFKYGPAQAWANFQRLLTEDTELAKEVILATAYSGRYSDSLYSNLDTGQLGWLYDSLRILFPPSEDPLIPDHCYSATPRHDAGRSRDSVIGWLVKLATPDSVQELDRICEAYSDSPWLIQARADARKNLWRRERTRLSFVELIRLLSDPDASVVRNSRELMSVVDASLRRFAHEAQHGSPPLAVFLWNEGLKTHFSEQRLSDFLKFYLDREWRGRRIIINREVEIRNLRDFGIGERTDLLIQAVTPKGDSHQLHPCVVIEVKVDKNIKPEDIPQQLVGKYLDGESRSCGIYLVGWFGKSNCTIEKLREKTVQSAMGNTSDKITVNSLILDLSHPLC